jgi:hypothetical protein
MKKVISLLLVSTVILSIGLSAKAEDIVKAGLTPDSSFYFLDSLGEKIGMFFAFSQEAKARKALTYAEEKLAEAEEVGDDEKVKVLKERYEQYMERVRVRLEQNNKEGIETNLSEIVSEKAARHFEVLDRIIEKAPEEAKAALLQVKENAMLRYEKALGFLAETNSDKAVEINDGLLRERLQIAKDLAKDNKEEVKDVIKDYDVFQGIFERLGNRGGQLKESIEGKTADQIKALYEIELNSENLSEETIQKINEVKERIQNRLEISLEKINETNPEKAAEINFKAAENRLEFLKDNIEEDGINIEKYINEFQERNQLRQKISEGIENKENISEEFRAFFETRTIDNENILKGFLDKVPTQTQNRINSSNK